MYIGSNRAAIMRFKTGDRVFGSGVLFVFASSYLRGDSCLIYVICVCLRYNGVQHVLYCVFLRIVCPMLPDYQCFASTNLKLNP